MNFVKVQKYAITPVAFQISLKFPQVTGLSEGKSVEKPEGHDRYKRCRNL